MLVRFNVNLGSGDAAYCNDKWHTQIDFTKCKAGQTADIPDVAADYLAGKYKSLFDVVGSVKGEAKSAELKAPAK